MLSGKEPMISIILPAYNVEDYIEQAITSLLNQSYADFELIIADDGSTDKTRTIIDALSKLDSRIICSHNESNQGKIKTANRLYNLCRGKYLSIHDSDDISHPQKFEKQLLFLEQNPEYAMCGTSYVIFYKNGIVVSEDLLEKDPYILREKSKHKSQFHGPTTLFKKSVVEEIGGLFRIFKLGEDVDLSMRIAEKHLCTNLGEMLYFYRWQPKSLTKSVESFNLDLLLKTKLLFYLREERDRNNGIDSVMKGDEKHISEMMELWKEEYKDPSYVYRYGAAKTLGTNMFKNSIILSLKALRTKFNLENIRCLFYCIRKSIIYNTVQLFRKKKNIQDYLNKNY
jgi:glycosyltransferase involved in cell wall biosynthesis